MALGGAGVPDRSGTDVLRVLGLAQAVVHGGHHDGRQPRRRILPANLSPDRLARNRHGQLHHFAQTANNQQEKL